VLTNLDVLRGFPLRIAVSYRLPDGSEITDVPAFGLDEVTPVFEEMPGFEEDVREVRDYGELPANARAYIEAIESYTGLPVRTISVGPARSEVIVRQS